MAETLPDETAEEIVRTCRAAIGDEVRNVTFITEDDYDIYYVREDVDADTEATGFIEAEQRGFASQRTYGWSDMGEYVFTIRAFEDGYIGRVIVGDQGVYVTADALTVDSFTDAAESIHDLLADAE
ncbi:hypothetical protein ACFQDG_05240 [Natronoarchaeum mannanilyticum]|uniref:Uncharacterized protein n=1 Tax=Natronoarchaeum mannanilyticum TaxID=926360 RepID=A0AAV3TBS1_9EURY